MYDEEPLSGGYMRLSWLSGKKLRSGEDSVASMRCVLPVLSVFILASCLLTMVPPPEFSLVSAAWSSLRSSHAGESASAMCAG